MGPFIYWQSCPDLTYELASFIPDQAIEITYGTFIRNVNREALLQNPWGKDALYRISCEDNWGRQFFKSTLPSGVTTYYLYWSGFEIYFLPSDHGTDLDLEQTILDQQDEQHENHRVRYG